MRSSDWEKVKLGELCQINKKTYSVSEKWGVVNYLDTGNLTEDQIQQFQYIETEKDKLPSRARRKVEYDDILYSTVRPNQHHYGIVKEIVPNMLVSTGFAVISVDKSKADSDFIYYYLTQNEIVETLHVIGEQSTSAYPSIKPSDITNLKLSLPSLEEQKEISRVLRLLDKKIENNKKINHHLEQMAMAIWKHLFGNREPNANLGDIIELFDSKRVPLSSKQREEMEKIYPYYGAATLMDYVESYLFDDIYLLLGEDGTVIESSGQPILQYVWGKFWVNNHAHVLQGKEGFSTESLYILLKQVNVSSIVTGAVQLKINQTNLKSLPIVRPTSGELDYFNNLIAPLFSKIRRNSDETSILTHLRDSLLPKLLSGEIPVNQAAK